MMWLAAFSRRTVSSELCRQCFPVMAFVIQVSLGFQQMSLGSNLVLQQIRVVTKNDPNMYHVYIYVYECAPVHIHAQFQRIYDVKVDSIVEFIWSKV